jgi:hypothetical protein
MKRSGIFACYVGMQKFYSTHKPMLSSSEASFHFGLTEAKRPLHIVCAYDRKDDLTIIITVYQRDSLGGKSIEGGQDEMHYLPW